MPSIAVGCSHTYGVGVETHEAWPNLLGAVNLGVRACSADHIARNMPSYLRKYNPEQVYVLWPNWARFEYVDHQGRYLQSLPTDKNRIYLMEKATDAWLQENYITQIERVRELCKDIKLIELTLYDLISYIDHADKWPVSKLGHHFNEVWHQWVADIFKNKAEWITDHRLFA